MGGINEDFLTIPLTIRILMVPGGKRIAFTSREGRNFAGRNYEIYVIDADGGNQHNLTNNRSHDTDPAWYNSVLAVAPTAKRLTIWGRLKQVGR